MLHKTDYLHLLETDCFPNLDTFPVCADPSWGLYRGKGVTEFFCCPANQKGVYPGPGVGAAGLCVASDMSVAVTQTAPKVLFSGVLTIAMAPSSNNGFDSIVQLAVPQRQAVRQPLQPKALLLKQVPPRVPARVHQHRGL